MYFIYQGGPIDQGTHVPVTVDQLITVSEYNAICTVGMDLAHFRMLINEWLDKVLDIFPEVAPLNILDIKSDVCMYKNVKDTKHTTHISKRFHFVGNGEKCKIHRIKWCELGLHLAEIASKNVGETDLNPRMKYIMVRLEKLENNCTRGVTWFKRFCGTKCSI